MARWVFLIFFLLPLIYSQTIPPFSLKVLPTDAADSEEDCKINRSWNRTEKCAYVKGNPDNCEGGGYLQWTRYVECQEKAANKVMVIIAGIIFLLVLFVMISSAADDFFSPNVAFIVSHLKISESIAGVTFMAFGNGAPDVFGSIASVLSSPTPKAGLALGELLGGTIFVTLMVTATIVLTKPFHIEIYATIRDLIFFLIALAWILFVFLYATKIYVWEPAGYLGIYVLYVITVIIGHQMYKKKRRQQRRQSSLNRSRRSVVLTRHNTIMPEVHMNGSTAVSQLSINSLVEEKEEKPEANKRQSIIAFGKPTVIEDIPNGKRTSIANGTGKSDANPMGMALHSSIMIPGTIITPQEGDLDEDSDSDDFVVTHNTVFHGPDARRRSLAASFLQPQVKITSTKTFFLDIYNHLRPLSDTEWEDANIFGKIMDVIKIGPTFALKMTIPLSEQNWSKSVAIIHSIFSPQFLLFAIKYSLYQPDSWGPGLYAYALIFSAVLVGLIMIFTKMDKEPKYFKELSSYAGFLMSIAWIYIIANEVVGIVTMIGVAFRLSHEVLGLTLLAWSNSIGDLIADVAVVKQGFPRMAMAAAIGGPLFNLLMGFGLPFTIAKLQGKTVLINLTPIYKVLMLFLGISLTTTLIGLFVQRFYLRRPYAFLLIGIYITFLIMVILTETKTVVWN